MSAIFCRLLFHDFSDKLVDEFLHLMQETQFRTVTEVNTQQPVSLDSDSFEKNTEVHFSFNLRAKNHKKSEKYHPICLALCELTKAFENFRRDLRGLSDFATVTMTVLSKNIYPKRFELQNLFVMDKLLFGSICNLRSFAPTYFFDAPKNDRGEHDIFVQYLDEQRDLEDIGSNMLICFEHDRECFTVCFPDVLKNWTAPKEQNNRTPKRVVDIKVFYSSLRRVIVSMATDENNEFKVTFTFQLHYPPTIQVYEQNGVNESKTKFKQPRRFLTWNKGHDIESALCHSACLVADCRMNDARTLLDCLDRLRKSSSYAIEFRVLYREKCINIKNYERNPFMHADDLPTNYAKLKEEKYFPLVYAVQALITRGGEIYDRFFRSRAKNFTFYRFLDSVVDHFDDDLKANPDAKIAKTVITLENMLLEIDKMNDVPEPLKFFQKLYSEPSHRIFADITDELAREGYMRVRKIIVTPTRKLYVNPELIMGNRSLRRKGADSMLRVVFRDDDNNKVSGLPKVLLDATVTNTLTEPLNVGFRDFSYLCSSNSQLRDHGCYFLAGLPEDVAKFLSECGIFKVEGIPKMMSRMGQCFTQARQLGVEIGRESYFETFDYIGGADGNGKPYTFSDGCGMISREYCRKIVADLKLGDCLPSCYQIRFRGYKGVVLMNSLLDETKNWAKNHDRIPLGEKNGSSVPSLAWYEQSLIFRSSQRKFHGPRERNVEIVKISSPILVSLNKPLINILDQVSEMHGTVSHKRMCNRIFELMEQHLESAISALIEETTAFLTLNEFPKYILYDRLRDFNITEEPFFRSLLRSAALVGLHKLVDKMQIRIPASQGRMMFGVVDETGLLQYGQVFIQYTTNAALKYPSQNADKIVHTGPVMITKNPSVVAGDVRMFEAVDLPCLYDLVDVVVFPQHGPRPHPDEMAGSDLDGDEYSIFWDPQLFLDRTEPAFDFTPAPKNENLETESEIKENLTQLMISFFKIYVSQDSVGSIANSHLANSDLYGINSEHCHNIALKHNQAVDFSKSGQIPDKLRKEWVDGLPPEKVERFPNFMCKEHASAYKSNRLLGALYNRAMEVREIIRVEEIASTDEKIKLDESVLMPGDEIFEENAQTAYDEYRTLIGSICESYGIANEGQLFSSRFTALKKRICEKDDDKMSLFNTQHMIEEQVAAIYAKFRTQFFDEFGGIEKNTELDERNYNGIRETFRRVCVLPSKQIQKKASAYYRMAYSNGKFLSFGWIVSDILSYNRQHYLLQPENFKLSLCPLIDYLSKYINEMCKSDMYDKEFNEFCKSLQKSYSQNKSSADVTLYVARMSHIFIGLNKLLFFCRKWVERHGIGCSADSAAENNIKPKIMDAVVVMYGLGELNKGDGGWLADCLVDKNHTVNLEEQLGGIGKRFWSLIRFLMTRSFGFSERILLEPVTNRYLESSQCHALYFAAEDTFYPIAINRRFDCLPGISKDQKAIQKVTEGNVFIVEISRNCENYKHLFEMLALKCGCSYLVLRRKPDRKNAKSFCVVLKPVGSFMAVRKFRNLLDVSPCMTEPNLQTRSDLIAEEIYKRLEFYTEEGRSVDDIFLP